jgi:hypothetical protein
MSSFYAQAHDERLRRAEQLQLQEEDDFRAFLIEAVRIWRAPSEACRIVRLHRPAFCVSQEQKYMHVSEQYNILSGKYKEECTRTECVLAAQPISFGQEGQGACATCACRTHDLLTMTTHSICTGNCNDWQMRAERHVRRWSTSSTRSTMSSNRSRRMHVHSRYALQTE